MFSSLERNLAVAVGIEGLEHHLVQMISALQF
jgi:hypothetical protein